MKNGPTSDAKSDANHLRCERLAFAGAEPGGVELFGDLRVGVIGGHALGQLVRQHWDWATEVASR